MQSTTNSNSIYNYNVTIKTLFKNDKNPIFIDKLRIKNVVIDYNYDSKVFPIIYASLALSTNMIKKLEENMSTGTVLFNLQKSVLNSNMPELKIDVIKEECIYYMSKSSDKFKNTELPEDKSNSEQYGFIITVGFISLNHVNYNKFHGSGIINNGDMISVIYYLLNKHKLLIEPFDNNKKLNNVVIPPSKSTYSCIDYLNDISAFYNTPYRFFMDFDITYLIGSYGQPIKLKGQITNTIKIKVLNFFDESNIEGIYKDNVDNIYIVPISASNATLLKNNITDKVVTGINAITSDGKSSKIDISNFDDNSDIENHLYNVRIPNDNKALLENMRINRLNNSIVVNVIKNNVDCSIFTINCSYYLDLDAVYGEEYSGNYILSSRKEVYMQQSDTLGMSIMLTFKKVHK